MFDGKSLNSWLFEKYGDVDENAIANPTTLSYTRLSELPNRFKFFQFSSKGKKKKSTGKMRKKRKTAYKISYKHYAKSRKRKKT